MTCMHENIIIAWQWWKSGSGFLFPASYFSSKIHIHAPKKLFLPPPQTLRKLSLSLVLLVSLRELVSSPSLLISFQNLTSYFFSKAEALLFLCSSFTETESLKFPDLPLSDTSLSLSLTGAPRRELLAIFLACFSFSWKIETHSLSFFELHFCIFFVSSLLPVNLFLSEPF